MLKIHVNAMLVSAMMLIAAAPSFGQTDAKGALPSEDKLIAVLKSDAQRKEKSDACRLLAVVGTKACVPVLAEMLANEEMSHMARYALEPIPDGAVDECFRDALGKLKGRLLTGVIESIGVRRDAKAVDALAGLLKDGRPGTIQGAARALGRIGNEPAAKALQGAVEGAQPVRQLAICEGLFRCAERLSADNQGKAAVAIYDQLRGLKDAAHQVRTAAVRGAILARAKDGLPLLKECLASSDYLVFAAACRASRDVPGPEATSALTDALKGAPANNQILLLQTLGFRADPAAVPAVASTAKSGDKAVRLAAIQTLSEIGHASVAPALEELAKDSDGDIAKAAKEGLASLRKQ